MYETKSTGNLTVADYLSGEQDSEVRHEYLCGEVYAMAGASVFHNLIATNLVRAFAIAAAQGPCRVYSSDMKVRVADDIFYYPDILVVCEELADTYFETAPCVVVEILSASTARRDCFEKRLAYQEVESLQLYLLVDSRKQAARGYYRTKTGWQERVFEVGQPVPVPCLNSELSFEELYAKVRFTGGQL